MRTHLHTAHIVVRMSMLVSSIVVHGHVPHSINESVIVPIIRSNNTGDAKIEGGSNISF